MSRFAKEVFISCAMLALGIGSAQSARAQQASEPESHHIINPDIQALAQSDLRFFGDAASDQLSEIATAQLAAQRSANADIRAYAQRVLDQRGAIGQQLQALAQRKGVTLPASTGAAQQQALAELSTRGGDEFDVAYARLQVQNAAAAIRLYRRAAKSADADIAAFAHKTLAALRQQLRLAQALR